MSETSSLTELARFVGRSKLNAENAALRRKAINTIASGIRPRGNHSVADLLGIVLVLSARTRRMVLPSVAIDLDVFSPQGGRAVRILTARR